MRRDSVASHDNVVDCDDVRLAEMLLDTSGVAVSESVGVGVVSCVAVLDDVGAGMLNDVDKLRVSDIVISLEADVVGDPEEEEECAAEAERVAVASSEWLTLLDGDEVGDTDHDNSFVPLIEADTRRGDRVNDSDTSCVAEPLLVGVVDISELVVSETRATLRVSDGLDDKLRDSVIASLGVAVRSNDSVADDVADRDGITDAVKELVCRCVSVPPVDDMVWGRDRLDKRVEVVERAEDSVCVSVVVGASVGLLEVDSVPRETLSDFDSVVEAVLLSLDDMVATVETERESETAVRVDDFCGEALRDGVGSTSALLECSMDAVRSDNEGLPLRDPDSVAVALCTFDNVHDCATVALCTLDDVHDCIAVALCTIDDVHDPEGRSLETDSDADIDGMIDTVPLDALRDIVCVLDADLVAESDALHVAVASGEAWESDLVGVVVIKGVMVIDGAVVIEGVGFERLPVPVSVTLTLMLPADAVLDKDGCEGDVDNESEGSAVVVCVNDGEADGESGGVAVAVAAGDAVTVRCGVNDADALPAVRVKEVELVSDAD